jgi:hypothetical protein
VGFFYHPKSKKTANMDFMREVIRTLRRHIGWREYIDLPDLKAKGIKVKVDTGATTSALHAENISIFTKNGKKKVSFTIYPKQRNKVKKVHAVADLVEMRNVRSSTGHLTERPVIRTTIRIGDEGPFEIEITLVNRDIMGFRMLLGRKALKKRFLVHPGKSFLISEKPTK